MKKMSTAFEKTIVFTTLRKYHSSDHDECVNMTKAAIIEKENIIKINFDLLLKAFVKNDMFDMAMWLVETKRANVNAYRGMLMKKVILSMKFSMVEKLYSLGGRIIDDADCTIYSLLFKRKNIAMLKLIYAHQKDIHNRSGMNRILVRTSNWHSYSTDMLKFLISHGADRISCLSENSKGRLRSDIKFMEKLPAYVQMLLAY